MAERLYMDYGVIEGLANKLGTVVQEIQNTKSRAESAANAVGDDQLNAKIEEFRDAWREKLNEMEGALNGLHEAVKTIIREIKDLDSQLEMKVNPLAPQPQPPAQPTCTPSSPQWPPPYNPPDWLTNPPPITKPK